MVGNWGRLWVPKRATFGADGGFDLVMHFHGGSADGRLKRAKVDAVVVSVNLGDGSGIYRRLFNARYTLDQCLRQVAREVKNRTGVAGAHVERLALSAFSAGYGAPASLLRVPNNIKRIDAVLLADGLHADFKDQKHRIILDAALTPFRSFGEAAKRGDKLMIVSYSQIPTDSFASTTETANYLIDRLKLETASTCPRSRRMPLLSCHQGGALRLAGYFGSHEPDHLLHVRFQDRLMYRDLAKRWAR